MSAGGASGRRGVDRHRPKASSLRDVTPPTHILDAAKVHLRDHVGKGRDPLLFPPRNGTGFLLESSLVKVYCPARRAAVRPDLRFHDLRHSDVTYAARLARPWPS
jgi:hypothetical protein